MNRQLADRLIAESARLKPVDDPLLDALRRALLVEDVLDVRITDDEFTLEILTDARRLSQLPSRDLR